MAETASLTIRLDEALKKRVETMADAEDRSVSEYVIRSLKERLDVQCPACGRSSGASVLPAGLSPAFRKWLDDTRVKKELSPFFVTVDEAGQRVVYWGQIRLQPEPDGALLMCLFSGPFGPRASKPQFPVAIPFGVITGWSWDMEGTEYSRLCAIGYVDGNEYARRVVAGRR